MSDDRILLIPTGGTIGAASYEDPHNPPPIVTTLKADQSLIDEAVAQLPHGERIDRHGWGTQEARFVKDSKLFTDDDIEVLAELIRNDSHRLFIITHGTDWMTQNAVKLQTLLRGADKVVVFVGSMVPLSMDKSPDSDGVAGLEFTLKNIDRQPAGVWVAGCDAHTGERAFFDPAVVQKDQKISRESKCFTLAVIER
jgi:L-asparaginase/Glu-tRNA(Gln) amidotransferase subunit D